MKGCLLCSCAVERFSAGIPVVEVWDVSDTPIDRCVGFSHIEAGSAVADFATDAGHAHAATITAGDERALRRRDASSPASKGALAPR